jgi:hypothetical protein
MPGENVGRLLDQPATVLLAAGKKKSPLTSAWLQR